ncbi:MAG: hypothetical protein ACRD2N_08010 [Vicinamibacterales bacterium]
MRAARQAGTRVATITPPNTMASARAKEIVSVVAGPDKDRKLNILVRRIDVDKVRMLDAGCR